MQVLHREQLRVSAWEAMTVTRSVYNLDDYDPLSTWRTSFEQSPKWQAIQLCARDIQFRKSPLPDLARWDIGVTIEILGLFASPQLETLYYLQYPLD